ncbi:pericentrin-like [Myxocyprinus asiaticus]|uniref:pericentrin-like n=1 Tax=Myxocyprinus asiaticus TaxID=70543 RepID=UPI00222360CC|nr:pericentrin-like [Myxocyprinus asiaticus]
MDQDERQRKLEAGRAKLAYFRQRRTKSESSRTQEKTEKRKGQTLQANDRSAQERHLEEPQTSYNHGEINKGNLEVSLRPDSTDKSVPEVHLGNREADAAQEQSSSSGSLAESELPDQAECELAEMIIVAHSGKEQLKQLQAAVEKRNEIISQLSMNLQLAQQSRDQVQLEAQQLVGQIQALQQQLQQLTKDQQCLLAQKEAEITDLQQKLGVMEKSLSQLQHAFTQRNTDQLEPRLDQLTGLDECTLSPLFPENSLDSNSDALLKRLRADLEEERKNTQQAHEQIEAFQKKVQSLENERTVMEAHLSEVQAQLKVAEKHALEAQQDKAEKGELNREMARLDNLVKELKNRLQEEEESGRHLRSKYEADISNYDLRLQTLEEERDLNVAQDVYSFDVSAGGFQDVLMECYLASEGVQESVLIEGSLEERSLVENSESRFDLDSEVICHPSDHPNNVASDGDKSQPVLFVDPGIGEIQLGEMSFTDAQWQNSTSVIEELNESAGTVDLAKELLIQQCRDLSEQLEDQDRQLEVLQEEVRHSAEEVEEARECWSKASEELEEAKWEQEMEREKRAQYEETVSQKTHQEDNLKNIVSHLQSQQQLLHQNKERIMPDNIDSDNKNSTLTMEELLKELREEKAQLVLQLKRQEQLAKDVHEQKAAGDSVSSEVHTHFGRQLSSLQGQRDDHLSKLEQQRENNKATSMLLGQRTLELDQANLELQQLKAELEEKVVRLQDLEKDKTDFESKLTCLKENLTNMEEEKTVLERHLQALQKQAKSMEEVLESELKDFEQHLESKDAELKEVREAQEKAEEEYMEKESALLKELTVVKKDLQERQKEHKEEQRWLEEKHQREVEDLNLRFERQLSELRSHLDDEQKRQISLIKQVNESEHERELSQLAAKQSEEISRLKDELSRELRDGLEAAHQAELLQTQSQHNLEVEALRLSLTNLHTAQLELSQANMQKEREAALSELQTMLREKWSQESAMLQARQQFELERLREQCREQEERAQSLHQQEIDNLNQEWERQVLEEQDSVERLQASKLEDLKAEWFVEAEMARTELLGRLNNTYQKLSETQAALSEAGEALAETQGRLEALELSREKDNNNLEKDLNQALADRDAAARAVEELVACQKVALQEQQDRARAMELREKALKQEVDRLQSEREELKANSEQEISNLWTQLECMRTNRQELGELKEQLLARSSRVDDLERLKQEFAQQQQEIKEQNEVELENLRTYFDQRLREAEKSHREEIALLQLRLVEGPLEDSMLKIGEASFLSEGKSKEERGDSMAEITQQQEKHKEDLDFLRLQLEERHQQEFEQLRSSIGLAYKEELLLAHTELTDRYYKDIDQLNTKHAQELEQLRAKLSDNQIKEITKLRLQSAQEIVRQVEAEVEERSRQHQAKVTQLETHLSQLSLKHTQELERVAEQHRQKEEMLQKDFTEELRVWLEDAQKEESQRVSEEVTQRSAEEQARLREQLQKQAEEHLASQREKLQRATLEERGELEQRLAEVQKLLDAERERLQALQKSLDCEENPQLMALKQKLQAQYDREMCTAKSTMAAEVKELNALLQDQMENKLQEAICRHQEEQRQLEEKLTHQRDATLGLLREQHAVELQAQKALLDQQAAQIEHLEKECQELKLHHQEEMESLRANHKTAFETLKMEAMEKHKVELDKLEAVLQETNLVQLEAQEAELQARHKQEREELEKRLLANMDTMESTYLKEIQAVQDEKKAELHDLQASLKERYTGEIEKQRKEEQTIREELRSELAKVHMDKFSAMAMELRQAHQEEMSEVLSSQRAALEDEHYSALEALQQQVVALEKQHSAALLEITEIATADKLQQKQQLDVLATQHQQQLQTCAEETLAKAETALREREQQLIHLKAEHDALRAELVAVKEGLSTSTERAEKLQEEGQTKDRALADLEVHNQHLKAELRSLQDDLTVQEEELAYQQTELEQLRQRCSLQEHHPKHNHRFLDGLSSDPSLSASLSSPEVLRRMDCREDRPSRLHVSHLSELSALHNASLELCSKPSPMERDTERPQARQTFIPPAETDQPSTHSPSQCSLTVSEHLSVLDSLDADKIHELENLDVTSSRSPLGSTSPVSVPEWVSDGYGSNVSSELEAMLKLEFENTERLDAHFVEYLRCRGMSPAENTDSAAGSMHESHERLTPELQAMLKRVYQESCRILSLSQRPTPSGQSHPDSEPAPPPSWQRERRALQETILSLRELLCRMADREPRTDSRDVDWRHEMLQAVRSVFDSEREWLHSQLQAVMGANTQIDHTPLMDQLQKLFQKQEEQQRRSLEQLFSADRHSLLAEVRNLHEQLHASTRQSQEQLQQLQDSLHTAKEQGTQTQHQLHRELEELELRLEQEQTLSHDLRSTLEAEKARGVEQQRQLEVELKAVSELKVELEETRLQLQSACKNQEELRSQINKLRLNVENVEAEHQACFQAVEKEQTRVQELQEELHQQRLCNQQTVQQSHHTQESLHLALNEQASHLSQLNSALEQERVTVSNLRSELQIEQSRCEALLAQERERTKLAVSRLEEERSRAAELSDSLSRQAQEHARRFEEEARRQESASAHDRKFIQDLRMQLEQERRQGEDLAAMLECLQGQVLEKKHRHAQEAEQAAHKEQEEARRLRAALEGLQAQKTEVGRTLEAERERATQLQAELDGMKEKMKEEGVREEQMERQVEKERRHECTNKKVLELELLHQRDQQRLKQLQEEKQLVSERLQRETHSNGLNLTQNILKKQSQDSASSTPSLTEGLLKENSEFSECLAALNEEKVSLKHTISCLERELHSLKCQEQVKSPALMEQSMLSEKLAWQKEKAALQAALRKAEAGLSKVTASNENRTISDLSNNKVQRLYERYLRAESYRKSLVYQKRYLLLLLGGFQECEQGTLALIARMGAQPTLSQPQVSRPLNRFRASVRVVIAISRLTFLTRKWQRATRKISVGSAMVNVHGTGQSTVPTLRTEVLKPQQTGAAFNSPPTRDHALTQRGMVSSLVSPIKSPFRLHNRMYPSPVLGPVDRSCSSSQDQEHSLTEYIQHLETVQQRLRAGFPGSSSGLPYARKSDR